MSTLDRLRTDPLDPDADLDGFTSDELEESLYGPDPARPRRSGPRTRPSRANRDAHRRVDRRRDRTTATALAFASVVFCAGIALHKFYLGRVGAGVLSILFVWTGIPWVVGVINAFQLLTMGDERFDEQYGWGD